MNHENDLIGYISQIDKMQDQMNILASFDVAIRPKCSQAALMTKGLLAIPLWTRTCVRRYIDRA
jgi:hypothetical protein